MIVKLREPMPWKRYRFKKRTVLALRMQEDFMFETVTGWQQGYKGQWLVESGDGMRSALDDESFQRQYHHEAGKQP